MKKFILYLIFTFLYMYDLESINVPDPETGNRLKGISFYLCKTICLMIEFTFLIYEGFQLKSLGMQYFSDFWNYSEIGGIVFFAIATLKDM